MKTIKTKHKFLVAATAAIGMSATGHAAAFDYATLITATNAEYTAAIAAVVGVAVLYLGVKAAGAGIRLLGSWVSKLSGGK